MANYPTPHINAAPADFAKTVLMPGDPLRAKFIAETYLSDPVLVNNVRGVQGYTGTYKGTRVSVMASGMGIPSIGIYSYELFTFFGVERIIRVGSAGALRPDIKVRDVVLGIGACTDSNYAAQFHLPGTFAPVAGYRLLKTAADIAEEMKLPYHVANLFSSDAFYKDEAALPEGMRSLASWQKMGVAAVEMEAAGLYMNAARAGKEALAVCTISDHLISHVETTAEERQTSFTDMMILALETAVRLEESDV